MSDSLPSFNLFQRSLGKISTPLSLEEIGKQALKHRFMPNEIGLTTDIVAGDKGKTRQDCFGGAKHGLHKVFNTIPSPSRIQNLTDRNFNKDLALVLDNLQRRLSYFIDSLVQDLSTTIPGREHTLSLDLGQANDAVNLDLVFTNDAELIRPKPQYTKITTRDSDNRDIEIELKPYLEVAKGDEEKQIDGYTLSLKDLENDYKVTIESPTSLGTNLQFYDSDGRIVRFGEDPVEAQVEDLGGSFGKVLSYDALAKKDKFSDPEIKFIFSTADLIIQYAQAGLASQGEDSDEVDAEYELIINDDPEISISYRNDSDSGKEYTLVTPEGTSYKVQRELATNLGGGKEAKIEHGLFVRIYSAQDQSGILCKKPNSKNQAVTAEQVFGKELYRKEQTPSL